MGGAHGRPRVDMPGGALHVPLIHPGVEHGGDEGGRARRHFPFVPFLDFPIEIRRLIYTTNGIESLNSRFR